MDGRRLDEMTRSLAARPASRRRLLADELVDFAPIGDEEGEGK